jgi:hypothetical protein
MVNGRVASIAAGIEVLAERYTAYSDNPIDRSHNDADNSEDTNDSEAMGTTAARI